MTNKPLIETNPNATYIAVKIARRIVLIEEAKNAGKLDDAAGWQLEVDALVQELKATGCA